MLRWLKRLVCKHEFEDEEIRGGFIIKDGWFVIPTICRCKKCGKTRSKE